MTLTVGSLFSGVGGFELGLSRAGFRVAWQCERDESCRRVLSRRFPGVPLSDDVHRLRAYLEPRNAARRLPDVVRPDLVCGGFPCQDLSVAGRRLGLAGGRSGLWFVFRRLLGLLRPRWVLVENVPGLLSSNHGRDMGAVLGGLAQLGYGWAYRVLDAQHFGVPQRRRRVFVVGCLGDCARAAKVLFESDGGEWDFAKGRTKGAGVAGSLAASSDRPGLKRDEESQLTVAHALTRRWDSGEDGTGRGTPLVVSDTGSSTWSEGRPTLPASDDNGTNHLVIPINADAAGGRTGDAETPSADAVGRVRLRPPGLGVGEPGGASFTVSAAGTPAVFQCHGGNVGPMGTLPSGNGGLTGGVPFVVRTAQTSANGHGVAEGVRHALDGANGQAVAVPFTFDWQNGGSHPTRPPTMNPVEDGTNALSSSRVPALSSGASVRRLTPLECERLQGFPDGWTEGLADSARYRALGNAVAVPVVEWIARRILAVAED